MHSTPARRIARSATVGLGGAALAFGAVAVPVAPAEAAAAPGTEVNLMTFNDFHGALSTGSEFACVITQQRAANETSFLLSAGDDVGGSSFASAIQNDTPTIEYLNALGVDASAVGNHEFDQGKEDLTDRIIPASDFPHISANVYKADGTRLVDAYTIVERNGVRVAVIGATTTKTTGKVSPSAIEGLEFRDPVDEVNKAVEELKASGEDVDIIVASYHEGASGNGKEGSAPSNNDPIFDKIVNETSPEVDAIFNGDSHSSYAYTADVPGDDPRPIIQGSSSGEFVGSVNLTLGEDGDWDITADTAPTLLPTEDLDTAACEGDEVYAKASGIAAKALEDAKGPASEQVGTIDGDITTAWDSSKAEYVDGVWTATGATGGPDIKGDDRSNYSASGYMLADSMKWFLEQRGTNEGEEIIGWMNPGGIRSEFWHKEDSGEGDGVVTYGEANDVVRFGNTLYSGQVTGAQFKQMLEEQWQRDASGKSTGEFLAFGVSQNVQFAYNPAGDEDDRIIDIRINGKPIDLEATYTIVGASFLFEGGDNMHALAKATNVRDTGVIDRDALSEYFKAKENQNLKPTFAQRQLSIQTVQEGRYDSAAGVDEDPVLRLRNLHSESLGAPKIEKVIVDAGEYGTFEAPYEQDDDGAWYADVTFTDWLCVPEGTEVPLTITAVPDTGTEYVLDMPAFTWENGNAPAECGADEPAPENPGGSDEGGDDQGGDQDGDDQGGDDQTGGGTDGEGKGTDGADDSSDRPKDPSYRAPESSDIARTGIDAAPLGAAALLLTLAGLGAYGLRSRVGRD